MNSNGETYVYMAIRRPHKPPTAATEVFSATTYTGNQVARHIGANTNRSDFAFLIDRDASSTNYPGSYGHYVISRSIPTISLASTRETVEVEGWNTYFGFDVNNGITVGGYSYQNKTGNDYVVQSFTRAPGFFDVCGYKGSGQPSYSTITHNLGAVPELIIIKRRNNGNGVWAVYSSVTGNSNYLRLNTNDASTTTSFWYNTDPTSTQFTVSNNNNVGNDANDYLAFLFASLDGISKVGSYSGTGSDVNVDCGFSAGARFVLIKRTNNTGSWFVYDSARGIVSGDDPYVLLNTTAAEVTNTDYIDPLNAGFTVTSSAPADLNENGSTYLFLAVA